MKSQELRNMFALRNRAEIGQGVVEYAGFLVMSALLVAGLLSGANHLMPALMSSLIQSNEMALSDGEPSLGGAPSSPAPTPAPSPAPSPSPTPSPSPSCPGNKKKC